MTYINLDPLEDGKSSIVLVNSMGSDIDVVNDARTSFGRTTDELTEKDEKLIQYLINNNHTSPLRGVVFKFRVKAPLFIGRQWWKHVIASSHNDEQVGWNEQSFRYVEIADGDDFYVPEKFRMQSSVNRQASEGELSDDHNNDAQTIYRETCEASYASYKKLIDLGIGREQARGVLVPAVYTTWVWTASLQTTLHFLDLRLGHGAQSEIGAYAQAIETLISPVVPVTIAAWRGRN